MASIFDSLRTTQRTMNGDIPKSLFDFDHLSDNVRKHLVKVYSTLALMVAVASLGTLIGIQYNISASMSGLLCLLSLIALAFVPYEQHGTRVGLIGAFGFFKGASLAPIVQYTLHYNPGVLPLAFSSTCIVFACFSAAALLSNRRDYLYLGGVLSSAISVMFWLSILNMFITIPSMSYIHLYGGLILFSLYVLYDSQLIVEKASRGNNDYIRHALELFIDFVALFVRILIILNKNNNNKKKKQKE